MKYYVIAGEASGDLHGSNLIKELQKLDKASNFRCWGGDKMEATGATLVKHYKDLAFMGFVEVIKNLPAILKNIFFCKNDILQYQPDTLLLIDYPGFNLRIATWAKKQGLRVIYYISPQIWAWKESRVKKIKQSVDKMLVILPFEQAFYKRWNYDVVYVGHPLVKVIDDFKQSNTNNQLPERVIAVLPGSRKQEISIKLPIMLSVANKFPTYNFIVAKAPGVEDEFYTSFLALYNNVHTVENKTYELLSNAQAAMVTSGTATLETALFSVPEIVCYKGGNISYQIAKRLVKIKYICLVNLIMDKEVVKELIQDELTTDNLAKELKNILENSSKKMQMQADYQSLKNLLNKGGNASANAAIQIHTFLKGAIQN